MKKFLSYNSLLFGIIFIWLATLFITISLSVRNLPWTPNFPYYEDIARYGRSLATFAHFDGIHYLRLIKQGYADVGSQAFFPVYPLLISSLTFGYFDPLYTAIITNTILVIASLYILFLSLPKSQALKFTILFLAFPTSFYLIFNYTESLFVFLTVLFFHLLRKHMYLIAAVVAAIASGTRLVGIFLSLSLAIEMYQSGQNLWKILLHTFISTLGLIVYMLFLYTRFADPLMFIHVQTMFGAGRSGGEIILLPQVIYRYLKILLTATPTTIVYARALWELLLFIISGFFLYLNRSKIPLSILAYSLLSILLPTLSGTLSSIPRYLLVLVPVVATGLGNITSKGLWATFTIQYAMLVIALALFVQGIFVA